MIFRQNVVAISNFFRAVSNIVFSFVRLNFVIVSNYFCLNTSNNIFLFRRISIIVCNYVCLNIFQSGSLLNVSIELERLEAIFDNFDLSRQGLPLRSLTLKPLRFSISNLSVQILFESLCSRFASLIDSRDPCICSANNLYIPTVLYFVVLRCRCCSLCIVKYSLLGEAASLISCILVVEFFITGAYKLFQTGYLAAPRCVVPLIHTYTAKQITVHWGRIIEVEVVRFECGNIAAFQHSALLGEQPSVDKLDLQRPSRGSKFVSNVDAVSLRWPPYGNELLSLFTSCLFRVLEFRQALWILDCSVFFVFFCCRLSCMSSRDSVLCARYS